MGEVEEGKGGYMGMEGDLTLGGEHKCVQYNIQMMYYRIQVPLKST